MKQFVGWIISAGVLVTSAAAGAQPLPSYGVGGYVTASDLGGPYAAMPPYPPPRGYGPPVAYGPTLLPPMEVYTVVRENGFSPLGVPRQRGLVYTIAVINRDGDDGRLVIDARNGRIIRFMPAYLMGDRLNDELGGAYGPEGPMLSTSSPSVEMRRPPRPPASVPRLASRSATAPLPKAAPPRAVGGPTKPLAAKPAAKPAGQAVVTPPKPAAPAAATPAAPDAATPAASEAAVPAVSAPAAPEAAAAKPATPPAQQSASTQGKPTAPEIAPAAPAPAEAKPAPAPVEAKQATPPVEAKPTPAQPTEAMPPAQGLN